MSVLLSEPYVPGFGAVTVAVQVGNEIWIGTNRGYRIGYFPARIKKRSPSTSLRSRYCCSDCASGCGASKNARMSATVQFSTRAEQSSGNCQPPDGQTTWEPRSHAPCSPDGGEARRTLPARARATSRNHQGLANELIECFHRARKSRPHSPTPAARWAAQLLLSRGVIRRETIRRLGRRMRHYAVMRAA